MEITMETVNMVSIFKRKQEWEDDITKEDEENIKMGLKRKCMNCHTEATLCECHLQTQTYWGY
jgi:hypothetical protein